MAEQKIWARDKFKVGDVVKRKDGKAFGDGNLFNTIREPGPYDTYQSPTVVWVNGGWLSVSLVEPALKSLKDWEAKVGDVFVYHADKSEKPTGKPRAITKVVGSYYYGKDILSKLSDTALSDCPYWSLVSRAKDVLVEDKTTEAKPDGGPAEYYDLPFKDWVTVNDMVEYLSDKQWGKHSWIFKDILKAVTRFGKKAGTDEAYVAKKIIYYGARLLMSVAGKATTRKYLQQLLDDKQFKENGQ